MSVHMFFTGPFTLTIWMWRALVCQMRTVDHFDQLLTVNRKSLKIPNDNLSYSLEVEARGRICLI